LSAHALCAFKKVAAKAQMLGYSLFAMQAQADRKSLLQSATAKPPGALPPGTLERTLAIIMGGGAARVCFR